MKLDWLQYFKEVAKAEHLGRAASTLHISPSAISRAIDLLEEEIGAKLFERQGRRIRLTMEGRKLYDRVLKITAEIDDLPRDIGKTSRLMGSYRVMASNVLSHRVAAPSLSKLFKAFPEFKCDLRSVRSSDVIAGLLRNECDIGLCFSPQVHPDLETIPIFKGQLRIVVRTKHPSLRKPMSSLAKYPAVLPPALQGIDICERHPMFEAFGIKVELMCTYDSYDSAAVIVAESDAWSFFPDVFLQYYHKQVQPVAAPKNWHAPYDISLVMNRNRPVRRLADELKVLLMKEVVPQ